MIWARRRRPGSHTDQSRVDHRNTAPPVFIPPLPVHPHFARQHLAPPRVAFCDLGQHHGIFDAWEVFETGAAA